MTLTWYGLSSFKITNVGDKITVITDPFAKETGLTPPRGAADVVLISRDQEPYNYTDGITGEPLIIRNPGEWDLKKGLAVQGILNDAEKENPTTVYRLQMDDLNMAFLGAVKGKEISEKVIEELEDIDVLIIPIGGNEVISWQDASHIVQKIEPKIVVPCFYKQPGLKVKLDEADKFMKDLGGDSREEERITLRRKDVLVENLQIIKLKPQR